MTDTASLSATPPDPRQGFALEWVLLCGGLLALALLISFWQAGDYRIHNEHERSRMLTQLELASNALLLRINAIELAHRNVSVEYTEGLAFNEDRLPFIRKRLRGFTEIIPLADGMLLLDDHAQLIASYPPGPAITPELPGHIAPANIPYDRLYLLHNTGNDHDLYLASHMARPQQPAALLLTRLSRSDLKHLLDAARYSPDMRAALYAADTLIQSSEADGHPLPPPPPLPDTPGTPHVEITGTGDATRIIARKQIRAAALDSSQPLVLSISHDLPPLFARPGHALWLVVALYTFILVTSLPALYFLQSKRRQIHASDLAARQAILHSNAELTRINSRLEEQGQYLQSLAFVDGLTGTANRRRFDETLNNEYRQWLRNGLPLSLIMLDVDYFKHYNDHYGHLAGDDCLKQIGSALRNALTRPRDLAARYGGEEFACILPDTSLAGALHKAEQIRSAVQQLGIAHEDSQAASVVTISLGVACFGPECDSPEALIQAADSALYQAKQQGRNQVVGMTAVF